MTHGYMFSGSGSNVYVQNLCRALVREGHDVHLLCQEPAPLSYDFVDEHRTANADGAHTHGEQETPYSGRCIVYNPEIGDLLPVYVYDEYPRWRVKTFLDLSDEEFEDYVEKNAAALRAVLGASGAEAVVTNHSVPGPLIARRALEGTGVPYTSIVHGSCLQYVSRRSETYMGVTREGLEGARKILALSSHSAGTIAEDFPEMKEKTLALPGGVDTGLFRPDALDPGALKALIGGPGRGPDQRAALLHALDDRTSSAAELAKRLHKVEASYDGRSHDSDAGERLGRLLEDGSPIIIYVGKLIHSKGVHSLISAFARIHRETGAHLLVVGYGTFREGLEALVHALGTGDRETLETLARGGALFEGGPEKRMEHFEVPESLLREASGMEDSVQFVGPLYHAELAKLLPAAEVAVVPSIFPETFGLVAAEFAASGVAPFVADHSGLREAGGIVGRGLPFDLRVGMDRFEEDLARALRDYLELPEEERRRCREVVRRNSVDYLSWNTLAEKVVKIAGEKD
ncbi:MAG TPA: glycosyltransferase family 4 protein [Rubrobacteraceae bacterium]|nr:glycosyltransferase family 4 protein [Rubrobacteraceae bacterium]